MKSEGILKRQEGPIQREVTMEGQVGAMHTEDGGRGCGKRTAGGRYQLQKVRKHIGSRSLEGT